MYRRIFSKKKHNKEYFRRLHTESRKNISIDDNLNSVGKLVNVQYFDSNSNSVKQNHNIGIYRGKNQIKHQNQQSIYLI